MYKTDATTFFTLYVCYRLSRFLSHCLALVLLLFDVGVANF